jgi:hypothetical protein
LGTSTDSLSTVPSAPSGDMRHMNLTRHWAPELCVPRQDSNLRPQDYPSGSCTPDLEGSG